MADRRSPEGRQLEIRLVAGQPGVRGEDHTGRDWQPGTPDQYELRLLQYEGSGPDERFRVLPEPPPRLFATRRTALEAAEALRREDSSLADVPIEVIAPRDNGESKES